MKSHIAWSMVICRLYSCSTTYETALTTHSNFITTRLKIVCFLTLNSVYSCLFWLHVATDLQHFYYYCRSSQQCCKTVAKQTNVILDFNPATLKMSGASSPEQIQIQHYMSVTKQNNYFMHMEAAGREECISLNNLRCR